MLSELYESEGKDECESKSEGQKKILARLDEWLLSPQQRSFVESLFEEQN